MDICLGLEIFPHPHTAVKVAEKLKDKLDEFEITSKVSYFVTDHASNMKAGFENLAELINKEHQIIIEHLMCSAQALNLIVSEGIKVFNKKEAFRQPFTFDNLRKIIAKIRKSSLIFREKAKECGDSEIKLPVKLNVATRWNSTMEMLRRANNMRKTIDLMTGIKLFLTKTLDYDIKIIFYCFLV